MLTPSDFRSLSKASEMICLIVHSMPLPKTNAMLTGLQFPGMEPQVFHLKVTQLGYGLEKLNTDTLSIIV